LRAVAVSSDGRHALSADLDGTARFWDVQTGGEVLRLEHLTAVLDVAISPDGRSALTGTRGGPGKGGLRRPSRPGSGRGLLGRPERPHLSAVRAVAFLPDGRGLSGGMDGRLVLWDLRLGRPLKTYGPQSGPIHSRAIAVFPDGRHVATAGGDRVVH